MNNHKDRKRTRLAGYDYAQDGHYFITICSKDREEFFGEIVDGRMILNELGRIVEKCWLEIPEHFPTVVLDEFVVMPNHVHGVVVIDNANNGWVGNKNFCSLRNAPWQTKLSRSLSSVVRGFKIGVTKWCRQNNDHYFQWQKSFYDHIICNESALNNIRKYIANNPLNWALEKDRNHLLNIDL